MFNSEALEVGIGMAFMFLLMSLICTGIKEVMEGVLKWRAMDLERALRTLLKDPRGELASVFYAHPLIASLFQGEYEPTKLRTWKLLPPFYDGTLYMGFIARHKLPSYIPSQHFAKALIDLIGRGPVSPAADLAATASLSVGQLRERAALLTSPTLQRIALSAIDHAEGDLNKLTANLQQWFDGAMDRASGWYKRRTQVLLFVLGLGAAAALNVDALYVMSRLTADKAFREAVVSAAAKVEAPNGASAPGETRPAAQTAPLGEIKPASSASAGAAGKPAPSAQAPGAPGAGGAETDASVPQDGSGAATQTMADSLRVALQAREQFDAIGMPIGWRAAEKMAVPTQMCKVAPATRCDSTGYSWVRVSIGWLITAFAIMLGAPFWFDVLNKFMVIRSTVKPAEKSGEEESKDPQAPGRQLPPVAAKAQPAVSAQPASPPAVVGPPAAAHFVEHAWKPGITNPKEMPL